MTGRARITSLRIRTEKAQVYGEEENFIVASCLKVPMENI